jgi:hypothetical protein
MARSGSRTASTSRSIATASAYLADIEHTQWNWAIASSEKLTPGRRRHPLPPRADEPPAAVEGLEVTLRLASSQRRRRLGPSTPGSPYDLRRPDGTRLVTPSSWIRRSRWDVLGVVAGRVQAVAENLGALRRVLEAGA